MGLNAPKAVSQGNPQRVTDHLDLVAKPVLQLAKAALDPVGVTCPCYAPSSTKSLNALYLLVASRAESLHCFTAAGTKQWSHKFSSYINGNSSSEENNEQSLIDIEFLELNAVDVTATGLFADQRADA